MKKMDEKWTFVMKSKTEWFDLHLKEVIQYRDLIWLFVKRNFTTMYKQTILGPMWLILVPLINTIISTFVFGTIAKIPSDGVPYFMFYMCGYMPWSYFSTCVTTTSSTFVSNANVFGKVYFPRLTVPISVVITNLLNFCIQLFMFSLFWIYYYLNGVKLHFNIFALIIIPVLVIMIALLGIGVGIIISSLTTKYRDLNVVVNFGVSLWMYITPVIYSSSTLGSTKLKNLVMLNPMAPIVESFRALLLGTSDIQWKYLGISVCLTFVVLFLGVVLFSKVEKTFMDTV